MNISARMRPVLAAHPYLAKAVTGAISGLGSAATVDLHAFMTWKSLDEAKRYNWGVAALRWAQGVVSGALLGLGWGALIS